MALVKSVPADPCPDHREAIRDGRARRPPVGVAPYDPGGSSNGRTADSDSACLGSNPSPPASLPGLYLSMTYSGRMFKSGCHKWGASLWQIPRISNVAVASVAVVIL